ncbi:conserved hypothetical protein [Ricinus communis]|uniref:Uncharacterized protein n=1 Tax=Ricinus communis TaxID=3988 RepID=B9RY02_RICCO|nr:conserved hypothetical protein [Ricinus communis]
MANVVDQARERIQSFELVRWFVVSKSRNKPARWLAKCLLSGSLPHAWVSCPPPELSFLLVSNFSFH